jgi:glycosyltransferase involved in cell wall biosynthesis/intein/homing endonuclease
MQKKKILLISDHLLSTSGVGTQSRYLVMGLVNTGKWTVRQLGAAVKHESYETVQAHEDVVVKPIDGFGTPDMIRLALATEKPDVLMLFTDPRFFHHIWQIEDEIHQICPIAYNHLWDNCEFPPIYNKVLYDSTDLINCINYPTFEFLNKHYPEKTNFVPHAVPRELFYPLPDGENLRNKKEFLKGRKEDTFTVLWVARNARRKMPGDVLWSWKLFLDQLESKHGHRDAVLVMHTDPYDQEGPNLDHIIDLFSLHNNVVFSNDRSSFPEMNKIYNLSDTILTRSCFPGETLVVTEDGYKEIRAVNVGEKVLTHKGQFQRVCKKSARPIEKGEGIFTIKVTNSQPLRVTGEHPVRAIKKSKVNFLINENVEKLESLITWEKVSDLNVGDYVVYDNEILQDKQIDKLDLFDLVKDVKKTISGTSTNQFHANDEVIFEGKIGSGREICKRFVKIDEDFAFILGLWVADGTTGCTSICLNKSKERDLAKRYVEAVKRSFGADCNVVENRGSRLPVYIRNGFVYKRMFSALCGKYSNGKYVPEIIKHSSKKIREAFLEGYVAGDGCILTHKQHETVKTRVRTVSHKLAYDIRTLLISLGHVPKMDFSSNTGFTKNKIWTVEWSHRKNHGQVNNASCRSWNVKNSFIVSRIFDISFQAESNETVYNFDVENDHSYATLNLTVHNCAEGFGLPTLEAMYCAKPIIALKTGGLERQVVDYRDGTENGVALPVELKSLVGSQSVPYIIDDYVSQETTAAGIMKMYEMGPEKRKELGQKAMKYAHEEFGMEKLIKSWDESLTKLVSEWKPGMKRWEAKKI